MSDSSAVIGDCERRMGKTIEVLQQDLAAIRTGRASPSLLDKVQVEAWGSAQPIQSVATISVPEPRLLVIQPWDKSLIGADREGDPEVRPRDQPEQRRLGDPAGAAAAQRAAPQRPREAGQEARRGVQGRRPQRPPRRRRRPEEAGEGRQALAGRAASAPSTACRSSPTARSGRSTRRPIARRGRSRRFDGYPAPDPWQAGRAARGPSRATSRSSWMATAGGRRARGLERLAGHRAGTENIRRIIEGCVELGDRDPDALRLLDGELAPPEPRGERPLRDPRPT